jgi:hypothetical protein
MIMQYCSNCGAENEAEAQFCAECGTPLDLADEATPATDDDQTLLSANVDDLAESQKTEIFKQDDTQATPETNEEDIIEGIASEASPSNPAPVITIDRPIQSETPPPPMTPTPPPPIPTEGGFNSFMSQRNLIIIGVIVLVLLCCCCCSPILISVLFSEEIDDAIREMSYLANYLSLV